MTNQKKVLRGIAQGALVLTLAGAVVGLLMGSASAQPYYGNVVHDCYGIWWNTDWNQDCPGGANFAGYYKSTADCTAPQIPDLSLQVYRPVGNSMSYDGTDCTYGIHSVHTVFWQ
jgi:hypothetical protein